MTLVLRPAAWWLKRGFTARLRSYGPDQGALRRRYGVTSDTPIVGYQGDTQARIEALAAKSPASFFAATSGSTRAPKQILFTRERVSRFKRQSRQAGICTFAHFGVSRADLFIMGSLKTDDSFTSLVLGDGQKTTGYITGLTDPTRYLRHDPLSGFVQSHGALATRFWLMVACNVGVIYSTNPSTLAVFLSDLSAEWDSARALIVDFVKGGDEVEPLRALVRRVGSRGHHERMTTIANAPDALPILECLPALEAYCCWDGGYVGTFLESVRRHLPPERVTHIPMYSMSTETVQTLPYSRGERLHFLPIAEGVLYEFLPADSLDDPEALLSPSALQPGESYAMVVSDPYGLKRYQTEDLFRCVEMIDGLPDLRFERRRGLTFSFTGEKLTGEQLTLAFAQLRAEDPTLREVDMTCLPSRPHEPALPGYALILGYPTDHPLGTADDVTIKRVARNFDTLLCDINQELASKHESNRLAPTRALALPYEALAASLDRRTASDGDRSQRSWESQFKLTPLTQRLFEDVDWSQ